MITQILATKGGSGGTGGGVPFTPTADMLMFFYFGSMAVVFIGVFIMLIAMRFQDDE